MNCPFTTLEQLRTFMDLGFNIKKLPYHRFSQNIEKEETKMGQYCCKICERETYWVRVLSESYRNRSKGLDTLPQMWDFINDKHIHEFEWSIILTKMGLNQ